MNVEINGVKYVPEPPKVDVGALSVEVYSEDLDETLTLREYFKRLLYTLWEESDGFSGKRPFGNSGWQLDIIYVLLEEGYISGSLTYSEDGYVQKAEYNREEAHKFISDLIVSL